MVLRVIGATHFQTLWECQLNLHSNFDKTLISLNIRDKIRVICSGKISGYPYLEHRNGSRYDNSARVLCFIRLHSVIENNNTYPTGVATQDKMLMKGFVVTDKSERIFDSTKHLTSSKWTTCSRGKSSYEELDGSILCMGWIHISLDLYFLDNWEVYAEVQANLDV
jgi:hypothetical protein